MNKGNSLPAAARLAVTNLVVAAAGAVLQIVSGADYPTVPPVFFILLIPAGLIAFGRWRWTPITAVPGGLFLTIGLFASGASPRLFDLSKFGVAVGLWVQSLAVIVAAVAAIIATVQNYRGRTAGTEWSPE